MLFHGGKIRHMGNVDEGSTTLDWMELERERGITITSACITMEWKQHSINLIDTPGHVDFTVEVERSTRVLDGAVTVLDGVAGVQAQTRTVWRQADRYQVPRVIFINKMDRVGASVSNTLASIRTRLGVSPLLLHHLSGDSHFDLVEMKKLDWTGRYGEEVVSQALTEQERAEAEPARARLVDDLSALDDEFLQKAIESPDQLTPADFKAALRRVTVAMKGFPVLVGSSLKYRGVQQILDAVVDFLPSPEDRPQITGLNGAGLPVVVKPTDPLCALAFKVVHDRSKGLIVFVRVYAGTLAPGQLLNVNKKTIERASKLFQVAAEDFIEVGSLKAGEIGALVGLKQFATGDTIASPGGKEQVRLPGILTPPPVFLTSVEPESEADYEPLEKALDILQLEDPSFRVTQSNNQLILSGMGELHLNIIHHRLRTHFKMDVTMSSPFIAYRTAASTPTRAKDVFNVVSASGQHLVTVDVSLEPIEQEEPETRCLVETVSEEATIGLSSAFQRGVPAGFPIVGTKATVHSIEPLDLPQGVHRRAVSQAVLAAFPNTNPNILEPIMSLELQVPTDYFGAVLSDLTGVRRGVVLDVLEGPGSKTIQAEVPLKALLGYSTALRSLSHGHATYEMAYAHQGPGKRFNVV